MSWARGAKDDLGRDIGYAIPAICDFADCGALIDRGLGYVCGSMHNGDHEDGCGRYFCELHRSTHPCEVRDAYWAEQDEEDEELRRLTGGR